MNLNTSCSSSRPFYSQCSITKIKDNFKLFAFQTSASISLIKCENNTKWSVYTQIELKDPLVQRQNVSHFEFLSTPSENLDSYTKEMLIGYRNGLLLQINYLENSIINKFNIVNYEEGEKYVSVQSILLNPIDPFTFYVLFSNSVLVKYALEKTEENQSFLEEKSRIVDKKKPIKNKNKTQVKENNNFKIIPNKYPLTPELNFTQGINLDKEAKNPLSFFFFSNCNAILEASLTQNAYFFNKYGANLLFTFVGYDGFLRIYDIETATPLLTFKSNYGGLNHFCYNSTGDLIGLAGHDDNIVLLDVETQNYITIEGHRSFVSKVILQDLTDNFIRVFAGSMDGNVSITDFSLEDVGIIKKSLNSEKNLKDKTKLPLKIIFNDFQAKRTKAKNINLGNCEGIGSIIFHEPHFIAAGFDGTVTIWSLEMEKENKKENNKDNNENNSENNENKDTNSIGEKSSKIKGVKEYEERKAETVDYRIKNSKYSNKN